MTSQVDKGISLIKYNYLNLPTQVLSSQGNTSYIYRADGTKVQKIFGSATTDYLDDFQYENEKLKFFPTAEGFYNAERGEYVYNYTDHLGNVRLSYNAADGGGIAVLEESNYYPFGLKHQGYNDGSLLNDFGTNYNYKYNGKELQETGMYDYGARFYMPDIGRWDVVDPLAENMSRWSPYNYAFNNPIKYIDIDGLAPGGPGDGTDGKTIRTQDIEEVVIYAQRKTRSLWNWAWNRIKRAFTSQYSPKTNADKYGGLNSYRQWQGSPFYNEGETKMDRMFRLMGNSKREEMLEFGGGGYNMFGGYGKVLSTEAKVLNEAQTILKEEKALKKIFELGTGQEVKIGGRTIVVEPEAPMSGLTLFEEDAFVLGKDAFSSPLELRKTILHELYRLNTSNLKGQNVTQGAVSGETKAAFDFAEKNAQKLK
jgi:RHS repeat-associated protein